MTNHSCDDGCVCPIHHTPLYYAPASNDHACQNADCEWAGGGFNPTRHAITQLITRRNTNRQESPDAP